jgi:hypothetical protein
MDLGQAQIGMIFLQDVGIPSVSQMLGGEVDDPIPRIVDPKGSLGIAHEMRKRESHDGRIAGFDAVTRRNMPSGQWAVEEVEPPRGGSAE